MLATLESSRRRRSSREPVVERLVAELGSLEEPVVLVIDDLNELLASEARATRGAARAASPLAPPTRPDEKPFTGG